MEWVGILLLIGGGMLAGFVGGVIGIGGGIIFAPFLFFYFESLGVDPSVITPLTLGSSLFCTWVVASVSAYFQHKRQAVNWTVAWQVGLASAVAIFLMTRFVTTQPWYNAGVFQTVFSVVLVVVAVRMFIGKKKRRDDEATDPKTLAWSTLLGTGTMAGALASAAGVGGGVILVPAYDHLLKLRLLQAVGTSSATIIFIALGGVLNYSLMGLGVDALPEGTFGYVDVMHAALLAVPSVPMARLGVWVSHKINTQWLRRGFAVLCLLVAVRLLMRVWG
ncbi:MAG: sulfite exporter TauE/SafE family protein [Rhodothermales bacterium]